MKYIANRKVEEEKPKRAMSLSLMDWNKTGSWRYLRPVRDEKIAPCNNACPAGNDIRKFISLAEKGKFHQAWEVIMETSPFPGVCGRVCYYPCEDACNRKEFDSSIGISSIERAVAQFGRKKIKKSKFKSIVDASVAIIGGGPAGLSCAYHLARNGYKVTIFEEKSNLGGMMRVGIPSYRLPRDILDTEIEDILSLDVNVELNTQLGRDIHLDNMAKFQAVFISIGSHKPRRLNIEGEDNKSVISGLKYLEELHSGQNVELGRKVIVTGGGDTAIDAARCAMRHNSEVEIIYRRSKQEMTAHIEEVNQAFEEGIKFTFLVAPVKIINRNGHAVVECQRMSLGEPDSSGRRVPIPVPGSNFCIEANTVIAAIGEIPEIEYLSKALTVEMNRVVVDKKYRTNIPRIFAGGESSTGMGSVSHAIGSGRQAAYHIMGYLEHGDSIVEENEFKIVAPEDINYDYFDIQDKVQVQILPIKKRITGFDEIKKGLSRTQLITESKRCFNCGMCNACDNCLIFCPDVAVKKDEKTMEYRIDYDYCKGCGICIEECPRSVLTLMEETRWKE